MGLFASTAWRERAGRRVFSSRSAMADDKRALCSLASCLTPLTPPLVSRLSRATAFLKSFSRIRMRRGLVLGGLAAGGYYAYSVTRPDTWESHIPAGARRVEKLPNGVVSVSSPLWGMPDLRRMAVVPTAAGSIVFSPICLPDNELEAALGDHNVAVIVVPAAMHRLDAAMWKARFPDAKVVCPDGIRNTVSNKVGVDDCYSGVFCPGNAFGVTEIPAPMKPGANESALFVDSAGCLLVCDVIENIDVSHMPGPLRWMAQRYLVDNSDGLTMSYGFRHWMSLGSSEMKKWLERLAAEAKARNIQTLFVCHGAPVHGANVDVSWEMTKLAEKL